MHVGIGLIVAGALVAARIGWRLVRTRGRSQEELR